MTLTLTTAPHPDVTTALAAVREVHLVGPEGRLELSEHPTTVDLLTTANDGFELLSSVNVPIGTYDEIRIVVDWLYVEMDLGDGEKRRLATDHFGGVLPEGQPLGAIRSTGWDPAGWRPTLDHPIRVNADDDLYYAVRLDLAEDLRPSKDGSWVLRPLLRGRSFAESTGVLLSLRLPKGAKTVVFDKLMPETMVRLTDRQGNLEGTLPLMQGGRKGQYEALFANLLPEQGPYEVTMIPPAGQSVITKPSFPVRVPVRAGSNGAVKFDIEP